MVNNIAMFTVGSLVAGLLSAITIPALTWFAPVAVIGEYSLLILVVNLTVMVAFLGVDQSFVREFHVVEDKSVLVKTAFSPGFFILLILCGVAVGILPLLDLGLSINTVVLVVVLVVVSYVYRGGLLQLRMLEKGGSYALLQVFPKLLFLMVFFLSVRLGFDVNVELLIVECFISILFCAVFLRKFECKSVCNAAFDNVLFQKMIRFGFPALLGGLAFWGLNSADRFFLAWLSTMEELGVYSVMVAVVSSVMLMQGVFLNVWGPYIIKKYEEGDFKYILDTSLELVLPIVVCIWCVTGLFSWLLPWFFPEKYESLEYLILISMGFPIFYLLAEIYGVGISLKRKTSYSALAALGSLVVNIILNLVLIPRMGALGAALATLFALIVYFLIRAWLGSLLLGRKLFFSWYLIHPLMLAVVSCFSAALQLQYVWVIYLAFLFVGIGGLIKSGVKLKKRLAQNG